MGEVNLRVNTAGVGIDLGSTGAGFALSQAELDTITASQLRLTSAVDITLSASVTLSPAQVPQLFLEAGLGAVTDGTGTEQTDLTVQNLAITTATGIGSSDDLDLAVTNLAFSNTTSGDVSITNTGALTINSVDGLTTSTNTSGGTTTITASSPLTFAVDTLSSGLAIYTAGEISDAGLCADDLTVNSGVTVASSSGDITLQAGDDIIINGTVSASGALNITAGFNDLDGCGELMIDGTPDQPQRAGRRVCRDDQ
jgi:hypothetical protein